MDSRKRIAGWATIALLLAVIVLGILDDRLKMSATVYNALKGVLLFAFFIAFWAYFGLSTAIEDRERPHHLAQVAARLGLTYVSQHGRGVTPLGRITSGLTEHVMVGEHDARKLITCLVTHLDPDGSDYRWCSVAELPSALSVFGINTHKSKIVACRDWPPTNRWKRRRVQTPDPIKAAILSDPRMREWLGTLDPSYHFHIHDRWVACEGPTVMLTNAEPRLEAQIRPVVETVIGFVERIPRHLFWVEGVATARPVP